MFDLVSRLATSLGQDYTTSWLRGSPAPVLTCKDARNPYQGAISVKMHPDVRAKLDGMDVAIRAALEDVYLEGVNRGRNALMQLADGDLTMGDFEKEVGLK